MRVIYHQMRKNNNAFCAMREERKAAREDARPPVHDQACGTPRVSVYCKIWRQELRCARVAAPLLRTILPSHSYSKSGVARNTACRRKFFRQTCGFRRKQTFNAQLSTLTAKRGRHPALPPTVCACRRGGARRARRRQYRFRRTRRHASRPRGRRCCGRPRGRAR